MSLAEAYAYCDRAARAANRDRWLGALFAPPEPRRRLHALIAFEEELGRLRETVRDPRAGEIRLVWWREALSGERRDEAAGNPLAAAMLDTLDALRPSPHLVENALNARQFDLYDDPPPTVHDLEAYLGETRAGLLQIAALAMAGGQDPGAADASGLAGVACGLIELLLRLSRPRAPSFAPRELLDRHNVTPEEFRARRGSPGMTAALREIAALARRRLSEAETARAKLPAALKPAYAGLATAPLWLGAIERGAERLFEAAPDVAAWRRQWVLWRWMRRPS